MPSGSATTTGIQIEPMRPARLRFVARTVQALVGEGDQQEAVRTVKILQVWAWDGIKWCWQDVPLEEEDG